MLHGDDSQIFHAVQQPLSVLFVLEPLPVFPLRDTSHITCNPIIYDGKTSRMFGLKDGVMEYGPGLS